MNPKNHDTQLAVTALFAELYVGETRNHTP